MWHVSATSDFDDVCLRSSQIHVNWISEFLKHNTYIASFKILKDQRSNEYDNQIPQYAAETIPKPISYTIIWTLLCSSRAWWIQIIVFELVHFC